MPCLSHWRLHLTSEMFVCSKMFVCWSAFAAVDTKSTMWAWIQMIYIHIGTLYDFSHPRIHGFIDGIIVHQVVHDCLLMMQVVNINKKNANQLMLFQWCMIHVIVNLFVITVEGYQDLSTNYNVYNLMYCTHVALYSETPTLYNSFVCYIDFHSQIDPMKFKAWIYNYISIKQWDVITHPCLNLNGSLYKLPLKLRLGLVITSHKKNMYVITHPCLKLPLELGHGWVITYHTKPCM